jgi:IS605 OrfB family transposase
MILSIKLKSLTNSEAQTKLEKLSKELNQLKNWISEIMNETKIYNKFEFQKQFYQLIRKEFDIKSQHIIRCIAEVSAQYKRENKFHKFRKMTFSIDKRLINLSLENHSIKITTNGKSLRLPIKYTKEQKRLIKEFKYGQGLIQKIDKDYYIVLQIEVPEKKMRKFKNMVGVDLGIKMLAVTSKKQYFSSEEVNKIREKYTKLRKNLQKKGTKSAKRKLKKLNRKISRYQKDINHKISKEIVGKAEGTRSYIGLENLTGIRKSKVNRKLRIQLSNWSFFQLRSFIEYKAKLKGIKVIAVDPKNTSRTCPKCGHISKNNRKTQEKFCCIKCGKEGNADYIASINIKNRAEKFMSTSLTEV